MKGNLSIRQLESLVVASRSESFSAAAKKLGVSQPSLSNAIATVERQLGVQLFNRSSRSISMTTQGARLAMAAAELLHIYNSAIVGIESNEREIRKIRLAALPGLSAWVIPSAVRQFQNTFPDCGVRLFDHKPSECFALLMDGLVDFALINELPDTSGMDVEVLGKTFMTVAVARDHHLAGRDRIGWGELQNEGFILAGGPQRRGYLGRMWDESGQQMAPRYEVEEIGTGIGLAAAGLGYMLIPNYFHINAIDPRLTCIPLASDTIGREIYMLRLKGTRLGEEARHLIELVSARLQSPAGVA